MSEFALESVEPGQVINLAGRLDVHAAADVRLALADAVEAGSGDLVIDLAVARRRGRDRARRPRRCSPPRRPGRSHARAARRTAPGRSAAVPDPAGSGAAHQQQRGLTSGPRPPRRFRGHGQRRLLALPARPAPAATPPSAAGRTPGAAGPIPGAVLPPLLALLLLAAGAGPSSGSSASAPRPMTRCTAVTTAAVASAGWSPSYVDKAGRPARWEPVHADPLRRPDPVDAGRRRDDLAGRAGRLAKASGLDVRRRRRHRRAAVAGPGGLPAGPLRQALGTAARRLGAARQTDLGHGVAGVTVVAIPGPKGAIVTGQVALDADHQLGSVPGGVLHELAHAVGLGHVLDPTQVMYPQTTNSESSMAPATGPVTGCTPWSSPRSCGRRAPSTVARTAVAIGATRRPSSEAPCPLVSCPCSPHFCAAARRPAAPRRLGGAAPWGIVDHAARPGTVDHRRRRRRFVDTGVTSADLRGRSAAVDEVDGGAADDCNGHGTHVAGIIGGRRREARAI